VGSGPFPTELLDAEGELMRKEGNEFGSTTGRPRRCGWIDLPSLKYSIMINGVTQLLMMKADVLNSFPVIKVCTHYKLSDGSITETVPYEIVNEKIIPIYHELQGWQTSIAGTSESDVPPNLLSYINFLEKSLNVPISLISIGPDRSQTILRSKIGV
jgi:adenylosuccinate synthase